MGLSIGHTGSMDSKIETGFKIIEITEEVKINLRISFIFLEFIIKKIKQGN